MKFFVVKGRPVYCRVFSSIPGFYTLDAKRYSPTPQIVIAKCPLRVKIIPAEKHTA